MVTVWDKLRNMLVERGTFEGQAGEVLKKLFLL